MTEGAARPTNESRIERWTRETRHLRQLAENSRPIEPHSSLAADDMAFLLYPASQVAWLGICYAIDHHDMYLRTLCETRTGFPFGYDTLARSALLGATRALWILDGTRSERIGRALQLAYEDYRQERQTHVEIAEMFPQDAAAHYEQVDLLDDRMAQAIAAGQQLGMAPKTVSSKPTDTSIIRHVAERFAAGETESELIVAGYTLGWRDGSGNAHGLRWTAMRRSTEITHDDNGRPHYRASADINKIVATAGRIHLPTCRAVEFFDRRRQAPAI